MKLFLVAFALIAAVAADVSHLPTNEYLPPVQQDVQTVALPSNEYLAPAIQEAPIEQGDLAADGYRYKTHKRVVVRRQRDVSHLPTNEYLPPVEQEVQTVALPSNEYLAPVVNDAPIEQGDLAADGYRYKTHKRVVVRRQRDVSHLPSNEYLPPVAVAAVAPSNDYLPPVAAPAPIEVSLPVEEAAPAHELADDGYRYKTHRRVVLRRHRRDVSHLPSNDYLPPVQEEVQTIALPSNEYLAPVVNDAPIEQGDLAADGYRYKTHKRVVVRRQRDVSHLPTNEYLPPVQEVAQDIAVPTNEYLAPVSNVVDEEQGSLADDGYRYKTHRRVVLRRHRRDVSHLPSNEYLPPVQEEVQTIALPSNEYLAPVVNDAPIEQGDLAADGYRYKTHKRVVLRRHRRDVSHLPSNEYLPPVAVAAVAPSNDYLPPVQIAAPVQVAAPAPIEVSLPVEEAAPAHELAADGYRYKTHRRVVYRRH